MPDRGSTAWFHSGSPTVAIGRRHPRSLASAKATDTAEDLPRMWSHRFQLAICCSHQFANAQMALLASTGDRSHPCSVPTASVRPAMPALQLAKTSDERVLELVGNARERYRCGTPYSAAAFHADSLGAQQPCQPHFRPFSSPIPYQASTFSTIFTLFHDRKRSSSVQRGDPARGRPRSIPFTMVSRPSCRPTSLNCLHHGSPRPHNQ